MKTQCPQCLTRWSGTMEQIFSNDRICPSCIPQLTAEALFNLTKSDGEFWTWNTLPQKRRNVYENYTR
jgi:hypothetical protein